MRKGFLLLIVSLCTCAAYSQPNSFDPAPEYELKARRSTQKAFVPKSRKGSFDYELDQQVKAYFQRVRQVEKRNRKWARISQRPQYSNPAYFGHKRKPKKRKVGKRKLCKECKIVH